MSTVFSKDDSGTDLGAILADLGFQNDPQNETKTTSKMRSKKRDGIWRLERFIPHGPAECAELLGLELREFITNSQQAWHPGKARGGGLQAPDGEDTGPLSLYRSVCLRRKSMFDIFYSGSESW